MVTPNYQGLTSLRTFFSLALTALQALLKDLSGRLSIRLRSLSNFLSSKHQWWVRWEHNRSSTLHIRVSRYHGSIMGSLMCKSVSMRFLSD